MSRFSKSHRPKRVSKKSGRVVSLAAFFLLSSALLTAQLFRIQVLHNKVYSKEGKEQYEVSRKIQQSRGEIFYRDLSKNSLAPLTVNEPVYDFYIVPKLVKDKDAFAKFLSEALGADSAEIAAKLTDSSDPYEHVRSGVEEEEKQRIIEHLKKSLIFEDAYGFKESFRRSYIGGDLTSHVTGFLGFSRDGEVRRGQYGVEEYFDADLTGAAGSIIADIDATGRQIPVGQRAIVRVDNGKDIVLTIDKNIQYKACTRLGEYVKKHEASGGAVIVIDPKTGDIYALCGAPSFDPNKYWDTQVSLFINPVTGAAYEPGSIFKPITMAAALDSGGVTPLTVFTDTGSVSIGSFTIRNAAGRMYGTNSMVQVLDKSINTGAIFAMRSIGPETFRKYVEAFGFAALTGVEIAGEVNGDISSLASGEEIYAATASFGQGITATPIQIMSAYAAIARGGVLVKPRLVSKIIDEDNEYEVPVIEGNRVISKETAETVSLMLVSAVKNGYAKHAGIPGYAIAGKTGTAEIPKTDERGYGEETIHSFVGFGPVDTFRSPVFAMLVKLDKPRGAVFADSTAAPLFHDIAEFILAYLRVPPTP